MAVGTNPTSPGNTGSQYIQPSPTFMGFDTQLFTNMLATLPFTGGSIKDIFKLWGTAPGQFLLGQQASQGREGELLSRMPAGPTYLQNIPRGMNEPGIAMTPEQSRMAGGRTRLSQSGVVSPQDLFMNPNMGYLGDEMAYAAQAGRADDLIRERMGGVRTAVSQGLRGAQGSLEDVDTLRKGGNEMFGAAAIGIEEARRANELTAKESISEMKALLLQGRQDFSNSLRDVKQERDAIMGASRDRSAAMMGRMSVSMAANAADTMRDMNGALLAAGTPQFQRLSAVTQMGWETARSIGDMAYQVSAQELARLDELSYSTGAWVTDLHKAGLTASTALHTQAMAGIEGTLANLTMRRNQLAEMDTLLANDAAQWNSSVLVMKDVLKGRMTELALQGETALFSMGAALQDYVIDFGPLMQDMFALDLSLDEAEYTQSMQRFALEANIYGTTVDDYMAGLDQMGARLAQDAAAKSAARSARRAQTMQVIGTVVAAIGGIFTGGAATPLIMGALAGAGEERDKSEPIVEADRSESGGVAFRDVGYGE